MAKEIEKIAIDNPLSWLGGGALLGAGTAALAAYSANKRYRKRSIFTRRLSDIFKSRKALKAVGYKRALLGGALAGGLGGYGLLSLKRMILGE